jgi:PKD repeat protein
MKRLLLLLFLLILFISPASAWLSGYGYQQQVTINGSSTNQTNYPVMFTVYAGTGTSSGSNVYLKNHLQDTTTWTDLRVTDTSDNVHPLYIETMNSTQATVWVNLTSVPTTGATAYIYYGKAGGTSVSNGTTTFPFFDHFDGASIDTSKWTALGNVSVTSSNATILRNGSDAYIYTKNTFGANFTIHTSVKSKHFQNTTYTEYIAWTGSTGDATPFFSFGSSTYGKKYRTYNGSVSTINPISNWYADTYGVVDIIRNATTSVSFLFNGYVSTSVTTLPTGAGKLYYYALTGNGSQIDVDYIFVRPYSYPEPAPSTYSAEETLTANFTSNTTTSAIYPLVVQFTDTSVGAPSSWNWSFGDGRYSTLQNPVYQYAVAGKYTVILNATNAYGSNTSTKTNYINLTSDDDGNLTSWLHMNGTQGSTVFNGEEGINWIVGGAAQITQLTKVFGSGSGRFISDSSYIYTPSSTAFNFGSGAGEIEMWVNVNGTINGMPLIKRGNNARTTGWGIYHTNASTASNAWAFYRGSTANNTNTFSLPVGVWTHLVVNWDNAGNSYVYVNGNRVATKTGTIGSYDTTDQIEIGRRGTPNIYFTGFIDEFRISKGNQRWKSNFTTPWAEYAGVLETIYPDINLNSTFRYKTDPTSYATIGNGTNGGTRNRTVQHENIINTSYIYGAVTYDELTVVPVAVRLNTTTYTTGMTLLNYTMDDENYGPEEGAEDIDVVTFNITRTPGFNNGTARTSFVDIQYLYYNYSDQPFTKTNFAFGYLINGTTGQHYPVHNFILTNMTLEPWIFTAAFTANTTTQRLGSPILFNSSFTGAYPNRWNWSWGDGTFENDVNQSNASHSWTDSGVKTITLREYLWQNESVNNTATQTVTIAPEPDFTALPTNGVAPLTVLFTGTATGTADTWSWNFGDGSPGSTTQSPAHTYTTTGVYTVSLTATNGSASATTTKTNYISLGAPGSPITAFHGTPLTGTPPLTVQFFDDSTSSPTGWVWDFGDGGTSTLRQPSHTYASVGSYNVILNASNAYGFNLKTEYNYINVSLAPTPTPTPSGNASTPTTFNGSIIQVENNGSTPFWFWIVLFGLALALLVLGLVMSASFFELLSFFFFIVCSYSSGYVVFSKVTIVDINSSITVIPNQTLAFQPYIAYLCYAFALLAFFLFILTIYNNMFEKSGLDAEVNLKGLDRKLR